MTIRNWKSYGTALLFSLTAVCHAVDIRETEGWDNASPHKADENDESIAWRGTFTPGLKDWIVEFRNGAKGDVKAIIPEDGSAPELRITKDGDAGYILVRSRQGIVFPAGMELQLSVQMKCSNALPDYTLGMLRLLDSLEDYTYDRTLDGRGGGGPQMQFMFNTPDKTWIRRLAHKKTTAARRKVYPAIIVAGNTSTSRWRLPQLEDFQKIKDNWARTYFKNPPKTYEADQVPEEEFDRMLAQSPDHTAKIVRANGYAVLAVDGKSVVPAFYKAIGSPAPDRNHHSGKIFSGAGFDLQVITIRYGDFAGPKSDKYGIWSRERFDIPAAVKIIKDAMRTAPDSCFVLTLLILPYREFGLDHPGEVWVQQDGKTVYGNHVHSPYSLKDRIPADYHPWVSYHSKLWRSMVKKHTLELIEVLKKEGLSKKIVGIHLGGGHDAQFSTRHLDYSPPAAAAFREYLKHRYGEVEALRRAWKMNDIDFENAPCPRFSRKSSDDVLVPETDQARIDFFHFQKTAPFEMLEDIGRAIRQGFGKDIVLMRWCMAAFSGDYGGAMDIGAFVNSKVFDILIAQSAYVRRQPGIPHGLRMPLASFRLHGKLFLQELDLRTWAAAAKETELRTFGLGTALNISMWKSLNRKLVGQMVAERMGYWYYDMAPGWYDVPAIAGDLRRQLETERNLLNTPPRKWKPDTAFILDEKGLFLRNLPGMHYIFDLENLISAQAQILAGSAVPYDYMLLDDLLARPELAESYKVLVFAGMYRIDEPRLKLLNHLKNQNRTLVFLSGTGRLGGCEAGTSFKVGTAQAPFRDHEVTATENTRINVLALPELKRISQFLGKTPSVYHSSARMEIAPDEQMEIPAIYRKDRSPAIAVRNCVGWKSVYVAEPAGLTPEFFNQLVRESGGYTVSTAGIQTDMNGNFLSVHGIVPGHYRITLPFPCEVVNLKNGLTVPLNGQNFELAVEAGTTCWFSLDPKTFNSAGEKNADTK